MIFVFGSNLAGIHGAGAALFAKDNFGAEFGVGYGPTGNAYAIPTKNRSIKTMSKTPIRYYVNEFIKYAKEHPELTFKVTRVGCGLAGYSNKDIAPMFKGSPVNCHFDYGWKPWLGDEYTYWGSA
jgi:hypothetical protein